MKLRVIIVGAGMVGARFADELIRADNASSTGAHPTDSNQFDITLFGAEQYQPYNRILLSDVVAGRADVASLTLPLPTPVNLRRGTSITAIDRAARQVHASDGTVHPYDRLVLATGARAYVPPMIGLEAAQPAGLHVLRTVDDGRDLIAASENANHIVVVGGGLLGLEAACGLQARGTRQHQVTIIHHRDHLLDRQLSSTAGQTLLHSVQDLGIDVILGGRPSQVRTRAGRVTGVRLADNRLINTDLLLLTCGARPDTALARAAELTVHDGIIVNDVLASPDDDHIYAIGDCAQPATGWTGLVAQGWEQARQLAKHLVQQRVSASSSIIAEPPTDPKLPDSLPQAAGTPRGNPGSVVRLKAVGLNVVVLGPPASDGSSTTPGAVRLNAIDEPHTVSLHDPQRRRHIEVTVREGKLTSATCLGAADVAANLTAAFDRQTPVPVDPAALLLSPGALGTTAAASGASAMAPTRMPANATVCRCNGVTKADVVTAWESGATDVPAVAACTRAGTGCGSCRDVVQGIIEWLDQAEPGRAEPGRAEPGRAEAHIALDPRTEHPMNLLPHSEPVSAVSGRLP